MVACVFRTIIIYAVVIFAMRLMGKRQLGELQPSELVTTFLISNVASICIDEPDLPLLASIVPILLIAALEILNSSAAWYFTKYAALLFGQPVTVIRNGEIDQDALRHLRITTGDLMEALRGKDIYDPQEVFWGVVEPNGSISTAAVPTAGQSAPMLPLIIDSQLYPDNLSLLGHSRAWLDQTLKSKGLRCEEVLIFLCNGKDTLLIPKKTARKEQSSIRKRP
ncbi:MAG: DUF421 domain-containing protein [Gemmiger sp.]